MKHGVYKTIRKTHRPDNEKIHKQRYGDHLLIELDQGFVLFQAVSNELTLHDTYKVPIQRRINEEEYYFLRSVLNNIDVDPPITDL